MNRQQATALVLYLNRAIGIVPTTGLEWSAIASVLPMIESVANGQFNLVPKDNEPLP